MCCLQLPEGRGQWGRAKWVKGNRRYRLPFMEWINHMGVRYSIGNIVNGIIKAL